MSNIDKRKILQSKFAEREINRRYYFWKKHCIYNFAVNWTFDIGIPAISIELQDTNDGEKR